MYEAGYCHASGIQISLKVWKDENWKSISPFNNGIVVMMECWEICNLSSPSSKEQIIKTNKQGDKVGVLETDYISHTFVWNQGVG